MLVFLFCRSLALRLMSAERHAGSESPHVEHTQCILITLCGGISLRLYNVQLFFPCGTPEAELVPC